MALRMRLEVGKGLGRIDGLMSEALPLLRLSVGGVVLERGGGGPGAMHGALSTLSD